MIELNIDNRKVTIYNAFDGEGKLLPLIIYNSFSGNAHDIYNKTKELNEKEYIFVVIENIDWDNEMTPYPNPPIFKNDSTYQGRASAYLSFIESLVIPSVKENILGEIKEYIIAGYSLAGLFSLYAVTKSNLFTKAISCSGSLWYPNFVNYFIGQDLLDAKAIYLSLGNKEQNSKDMSSCVLNKTEELFNYLQDKKTKTVFELNEGGHFKDINVRVAKGIVWILKH